MRGQTSLEYLLLTAGIVVVAVTAGYYLTSSVTLTTHGTEVDFTKPVIDIVSPPSGATLTSTTVTVEFNVSDDHALASIAIDCNSDGTPEGTINNPSNPYSGTYVCTYGSPGSYTIKIIATDSSGNVKVATRYFTIVSSNTTPPTITSFTVSPTSGDTSTTFTISCSATDDKQVSSILLLDNGTLLYSCSGATCSYSTTLTAGTHIIECNAVDIGGNSTAESKQISVSSTNTPPVVTITSPADGSEFNVGDTVVVAWNVSDPDGDTITSQTVDCGNGTTVTPSGTTAQCVYSSPGTYQITVTAVDTWGASGADSVQITVKQPQSVTVTIIRPADGSTFYVSQEVNVEFSIYVAGDAIDAIEANCGNGVTLLLPSSARSFTCSYTSVGTYTIRVSVRTTSGLTDSDSVDINVVNAPECTTDSDCPPDGWVIPPDVPGCGPDPIAEYRDYSCVNGSCTYTVTQTYSCDENDVCSGVCVNGTYYEYEDWYVDCFPAGTYTDPSTGVQEIICLPTCAREYGSIVEPDTSSAACTCAGGEWYTDHCCGDDAGEQTSSDCTAGETFDPTTCACTSDTTPPTITSITYSAPDDVDNTQITFTCSASDDTSLASITVKLSSTEFNTCTVSGTSASCSYTITATYGGPYDVLCEATDAAGNTASDHNVFIVYKYMNYANNCGEGTCEAIVNTISYGVKSGCKWVNLYGADTVVNYATDGTTITAADGTTWVCTQSNGTDYYWQQSTSDTTPPTITSFTVSPTSGDENTVFTISCSAQDNESGLASIQIYVDNTLKQTCTSSPCSYASTYPADTHTTYCKATDNAGNEATSSTLSFTVSSTAPYTYLNYLDSCSGTTCEWLVSQSSTGTTPGCKYTDTSGNVYYETDTSKLYYDAVAGVYYHCAQIDPTTFKWVESTEGDQPPTATLTVSPESGAQGTTFSISCSATDDVGLTSIEINVLDVGSRTCSVSGTSGTCTYSLSSTTTQSLLGTYSVSCIATDTQGQTGSDTASFTVHQNVTFPNVLNVVEDPYGQPSYGIGDSITCPYDGSTLTCNGKTVYGYQPGSGQCLEEDIDNVNNTVSYFIHNNGETVQGSDFNYLCQDGEWTRTVTFPNVLVEAPASEPYLEGPVTCTYDGSSLTCDGYPVSGYQEPGYGRCLKKVVGQSGTTYYLVAAGSNEYLSDGTFYHCADSKWSREVAYPNYASDCSASSSGVYCGTLEQPSTPVICTINGGSVECFGYSTTFYSDECLIYGGSWITLGSSVDIGGDTYTCNDRTWAQCTSDSDCDSLDGYYCNGDILEYRDYYCNNGVCEYTITSSEDCSGTCYGGGGEPCGYCGTNNGTAQCLCDVFCAGTPYE